MAGIFRAPGRWLVAWALMLEVTSCQDTLVLGERSGLMSDVAAGGSATGGEPASGGANTGGAAGSPRSCPGTGGPAMVRLPQGYCIDSTEVTVRQYQDWLDKSPPTTDQTGRCTGNVGFVPMASCLDGGVRPGDYPVVCVDWCGAYYYCQSVGKRLCGRIGGGPLSSMDDSSRADVSQWHNACVSDGARNEYPCGAGCQPSACNGAYDPDTGTYAKGKSPVPVGSMQSCQSPVPGYQGVFDLSGNVWEWEDACEDLECAIRGSSFRDGTLDCDCVFRAPFDQPSDNIGFRCCAP